MIFFLSLVLGVCFVGCSDKDDSENISVDNTDALISNFTLPANAKYASGLADLYFSIVQQGQYEEGKGYVGQIFNADSLPVGTVTNSLLANITTTSAYEVMLFNYSEETKLYSDSSLYSSTDSIDFTHPLMVRVTAANRTTKKFYEVKLNVHKQNPDSIDWQLYKNNALSDFSDIEQQKAIAYGDDMFWYTATAVKVTLNKSPKSDLSTWTPNDVSWTLSGMPDLSTITQFGDEIYCLTNDGEMMISSDGVNFEGMSDNTGFVNIIGVYGVSSSSQQLVAIRKVDGVNYFSYYTKESGWLNNGTVPSNFPVTGFSNPVSYTMSKMDRLNIAGGITEGGAYISSVWSYDGVNPWAEFQQRNVRAGAGKTLVTYEHDPRYKDTFWFMLCGATSPISYTKTVYYSNDKGVSWKEAESLVTFPDDFTTRGFASPYVDEDFYINLIGGKNRSGELNQIWRGRLNNLLFKPVE